VAYQAQITEYRGELLPPRYFIKRGCDLGKSLCGNALAPKRNRNRPQRKQAAVT
jgi:hypothetical protein